MPETFNPIITHLYSGQGGTSNEVTKYNNSTISEINVVDNGVTTKYDFGKLSIIPVTDSILKNTIKQPLDSVKFYGNTMRWCQLCVDPTFATPNMWDLNASMTLENNKITMQGTGNTSTAFSMRSPQGNNFKGVNGHIYIFSAIVTSSVQTTGSQFRVFTGSEWGYPSAPTIPVGKSRVSVMWQFNKTSSENCRLYFYSSVAGVSDGLPVGETMVMENLQIFDLTYIFGTGNEPSTEAEFIRRLKKLVYPYSPGEIISIEQASAYLYGLNIWDEEWESGAYATSTGAKYADENKIRCKNLIRVLPSTEYYKTAPSSVYWQLFYDANGNYISYSGGTGAFTTPANACYMTFFCENAYGTTYNHDICISLSNASTNGTYEASKGEQSMRLLSTNIYDRRLDTTGYALNSIGNIESNSHRVVSDYIDVYGASYVSMNYGASYAFYNESKVFISGDTKSFSVFRSYAIPSGAKYIRIDNVIDTIYGQDIMMVFGQYTSETLPSYVPYGYGYATLNGVGDAIDTVTVNKNNTGSYVKNVGVYIFTGNEVVSPYGAGYYFNSSVLSQTPKLPTMNIVCPVLHPTDAPIDAQTDSSAICFWVNGNIYIGTSPANLVGVPLYYELATPVETALTAEQCAEILNGAFTKSKYSTLLIDNDNGQIDQTVDVGMWEQR